MHRVQQVLDDVEASGFGSWGALGRRCQSRPLYLADLPTSCLSSSARSRAESCVCRRKAEIFSPSLGCGCLPHPQVGIHWLLIYFPGWEDALVPGEGTPAWWGALQRSPTSQAGNGIGGL